MPVKLGLALRFYFLIFAAIIVDVRSARAAILNVKQFDARGDGQFRNDGRMSQGSSTLVSRGASFKTSDRGSSIYILGAGRTVKVNSYSSSNLYDSTDHRAIYTTNDPLFTTIASVENSDTITLADAALSSVQNASFAWGSDDRSPIEATISAAASRGGGTVFFPAGVYLLFNNGLSLTSSHIRLTGQGDRSTIYMAGVLRSGANFPGDGLSVIGVGDVNNPIGDIEIDHLVLANAGKAVHEPVNGAGLIQLLDHTIVENPRFHDLRLETASRVGLGSGASADDIQIYDNRVSGGVHGLYIAGRGNGGIIENNRLVNLPSLLSLYNSEGIALKNHSSVEVSHNYIRNYTYGIELSMNKLIRTRINQNTIVGCAEGIVGTEGSEVVISHNTVLDAVDHAVRFTANHPMDNIQIVNNLISFVNREHSAGYKIVVGVSPDCRCNNSNVTIAGNKLNGGSGIQLYNATGHNLVKGNQLLNEGGTKAVSFYIFDVSSEGSVTILANNRTVGYSTFSIEPNVRKYENDLH